MRFFYSNEIYEEKIILSGSEFHHCINVLRNSINDIIMVIDGRGHLYTAELIQIDDKYATAIIVNVQNEYKKSKNYIHIAISPTKSIDRLEWFIEKAVEIGINQITLLDCDRTERHKIKIDRCQKIIMSATKQSLRAYLPVLNPLVKFEKFITKNHHEKLKSIAFLDSEKSIDFSDYHSNSDSHLVCIGPEGDFTSNEIEMAINKGFKCTLLGESRLRTETAAVVVSVLINL